MNFFSLLSAAEGAGETKNMSQRRQNGEEKHGIKQKISG
jgi:hypothetical protein